MHGDILIVDDQLVNLALLESLLETEGYDVRTATNGQQALDAMRFGAPELILLDINLPEIDGFEVCRRLKAASATAAIPILFLSAYAETDEKLRAFASGGQDYITKPYVAAEVLARVDMHLRLSRMERNLQTELRRSQASLSALIESTRDLIWAVDLDFNLMVYNTALDQHFAHNYGTHARLGAAPKDFLPPERAARWAPLYRRALTEGAYQLEYGLPDGRILEMAFQPMIEGQKQIGVSVFGKDITERKRAEEALRRDAERAEAVARMAARLNASFGLPDVLNTICQEIAVALESPVTTIWLADDDQRAAHLQSAFGLPPESWPRFQPIPNRISPLYQRQREDIYYLPDAGLVSDNPNVPLCHEFQLQAVMVCRLNHAGQYIGFLAVFRHSVGAAFSEADLTLLDTVRHQMAIAIHHARLYEQVAGGRERLQAMSERLVEIQEAERRHLAIELHDEIGQALTQIKMSLDRFDLAHPERGNLEMAREMTVDLMQRVRSLSLELRPAILDDLGLLPAALWHLERYTALTGVQVDFKPSGVDRRFPAQIESTAYRILQESLTNIARHAKATRVTVSLWADEDRLGLQVEDNGAGFDLAVVSQRLTGGLSGMQERAKICGGQLLIDSRPGQGTYVSLELPVQGQWVERRSR